MYPFLSFFQKNLFDPIKLINFKEVLGKNTLIFSIKNEVFKQLLQIDIQAVKKKCNFVLQIRVNYLALK